jgi:hypothetical protein
VVHTALDQSMEGGDKADTGSHLAPFGQLNPLEEVLKHARDESSLWGASRQALFRLLGSNHRLNLLTLQ